MTPVANGVTELRTSRYRIVLAILFALLLPLTATAQSLDQAASQAARQYDAKVLSARTVQEGNQFVHVIKLLTQDGVVKTVRVPVQTKKKR